MAEKVIKHSDIIEENVFAPTIKEGKELLSVLDQIEKGLKSTLSVSKGALQKNPTNAKDLEEFSKNIDKVNESEKALLETQKARAKIQVQNQERAKQLKQEAKDALGLTNEYQKQSRRLNDLRNAYKNLAVQNRENGTVAKGLKQEIDKLDKSLKAVDATVGQHQRNVGNYKDALDGLSGGLGNSIRALQAFGVASLKLLKNPVVLLLAGIVAGLTALTSAFKSTDEGANDFDSILKSVSNTIDVVRQRLGIFASGLKDFFSGNFTEGAEKMASAFNNISVQIAEAAKAGREYALALDDIEDAETAFISRHAEIANKIARLEFFAADSLNSPQSRIKALEEVLRLSAEVANEEENIAKKKFNLEVSNLEKTRNLNAKIIKEQIQFSEQNQKLQDAGFTEEEIKNLEELFAKIQETNAKVFEENIKNNAKLSNLKRDLIAEEEKKIEEAQKEADRLSKIDLDKIEKNAELVKKLKKEVRDAEIEADKDAHEEALKLLEEEEKRKIEAAEKEIERVEQINSAIFAGLDERSERQQKALQEEISRRDKAITEQQARAEQGLTNTLAFEQQKRDEAQLALKESEEREAKRKEAQELGEIFLEFLKQRAKEPGGTGSAASKALADTLVAKAIKRTVASFYVGTEDTGKVSAPLDEKGGRLALLHDNERVLTKEQNKLIGDISNNDLAMLAYRSNIESKDNKAVSGDSVVLNLLNNKLTSLENAIKNKREISINWDSYGARVEEVVEKGMKTVYKKVTTGKRRI